MYVIKETECAGCGLCADVCQEGAISPIGPYRINPEKCNECGECAKSCPLGVIILDTKR